MAGWLDGVVIENRQWSERLFSLRIRAPLADFKAGQFVRVALDIDGERVARPYSLVNAPGDELLEIYFNIVEQGPLTPRLAALRSTRGREQKKDKDGVPDQEMHYTIFVMTESEWTGLQIRGAGGHREPWG